MLPTMRLLLLICTALALGAAEDDPVAKELARYDEAVAKLHRTLDEASARERAKSVPVLAAIAKKQLAKGDLPMAVKAWKAVLRLDRANPDARQFFTSMNQLDQTLAELDREDASGGDLIADGNPLPPGKPREVVAKVNAQIPLDLGAVTAGTVLSFQYVDGAWTFREGMQPMLSPDAPDAPPTYRLAIAPPGGEAIVVVGAGTAEKPFTWTADKDYPSLSLRISRTGRAPAGTANYRLRVVKPVR